YVCRIWCGWKCSIFVSFRTCRVRPVPSVRGIRRPTSGNSASNAGDNGTRRTRPLFVWCTTRHPPCTSDRFARTSSPHLKALRLPCEVGAERVGASRSSPTWSCPGRHLGGQRRPWTDSSVEGRQPLFTECGGCSFISRC